MGHQVRTKEPFTGWKGLIDWLIDWLRWSTRQATILLALTGMLWPQSQQTWTLTSTPQTFRSVPHSYQASRQEVRDGVGTINMSPTFCSSTNSGTGQSGTLETHPSFLHINSKQTIEWLTALSKARITQKPLGDCGQTACLLSSKQEQQQSGHWQKPCGK